MKKYVYIQNGRVHEIINEVDSMFPDVGIEQRYAQELLNKCVVVEEGQEPPVGYLYENGIFINPPVIEAEETIEDKKTMLEQQILLLQQQLNELGNV